MSLFLDDPVDPVDLTTFVRQVPTPAGNALSALFPTMYKDSDTIDWSEITQTNRTATYRAFDGDIAVSTRDAGSSKRVRLAPLSSSIGVGEYERLQLEFARTGGTRKAALANAVYNDAEKLTREVLNRAELAWGDVLTDGKFTLNEGNLSIEADYGMPGTHVKTAADSWANVATADPLTELVAWNDTYIDTNGAGAGWILTSNKVIRLLLKSAEVINAVHGSAAGRTMVTLQQLNDQLASMSLPQLLPAYDTKLNVAGADTRVIADDKVIFLPSNLADLGYFAWGISATALELTGSTQVDMAFEQAAGIVGVVVKSGKPPYRSTTYVDAVGQPVLTDAKRLLVADVIS